MRAPAAAPAALSGPAELAQAKARARRAYADARRKGAAPPILCDRWLADMLLAIDRAPAQVQLTMCTRTETLFKLLIDRRCWLAERDAAGRIIKG